ncbi:hypothetical protein GQ600_19283 [Phytophthora cactorum]|nr:hypothetical protein GQ600_19283 [Phytophthora cactorum]
MAFFMKRENCQAIDFLVWYRYFQGATCIRPQQTDRAGATADVSLGEVAAELEAHCGSGFQATTVTWRLETIAEPQFLSNYCEIYLHKGAQTVNLARSARIALDCVNGALIDNDVLRQDWSAFGQRMTAHRENLTSKKNFIDDFDLVPIADVIGPIPQMENLDDFGHVE